MAEEAVILHRHEGLLQAARDLGDGDVVAGGVEPEPAAAVGRVEPGVADAAREGVHGDGFATQLDQQAEPHDCQQQDQPPGASPERA